MNTNRYCRFLLDSARYLELEPAVALRALCASFAAGRPDTETCHS